MSSLHQAARTLCPSCGADQGKACRDEHRRKVPPHRKRIDLSERVKSAPRLRTRPMPEHLGTSWRKGGDPAEVRPNRLSSLADDRTAMKARSYPHPGVGISDAFMKMRGSRPQGAHGPPAAAPGKPGLPVESAHFLRRPKVRSGHGLGWIPGMGICHLPGSMLSIDRPACKRSPP